MNLVKIKDIQLATIIIRRVITIRVAIIISSRGGTIIITRRVVISMAIRRLISITIHTRQDLILVPKVIMNMRSIIILILVLLNITSLSPTNT